MSRHPSMLVVLIATVGMALACGSSTAPANLTGPYVGTYTMDSVTASELAKFGVPHGTLDSADGVTGTLTLTSDSFYVTLTGTLLEGLSASHTPAVADSGTFTISSSNQWTLGGSLFSGTGTGALVGNQLELTLTGGTELGNLYGLFTQQ